MEVLALRVYGSGEIQREAALDPAAGVCRPRKRGCSRSVTWVLMVLSKAPSFPGSWASEGGGGAGLTDKVSVPVLGRRPYRCWQMDRLLGRKGRQLAGIVGLLPLPDWGGDRELP